MILDYFPASLNYEYEEGIIAAIYTNKIMLFSLKLGSLL